MNLTLQTQAARGDSAQVGALIAGGLKLYTIERPWRDNHPYESCVPAGEFELHPYQSPKHGTTWRLHNPALGIWGASTLAPNGMRTEIEIHPANFARELLGCIAVGTSNLDMLDPVSHSVAPAVQDSRHAFELLREQLTLSESDIHLLTITRDVITTPREG